MNKKFTKLIAALALLVFMTPSLAGWGQTRAEGDTHEFSQTIQQLLNNNASIPSIEIPAQSYPVKKVTISYRYNKEITNAVTMEVTVGGTSWGTQYSTGTGNNYTTVDFEGTSTIGAIVISFTNNTGNGTGHGTFYVNNVILTEGSSGPAPTYTVTFDAGDGTFAGNEDFPTESNEVTAGTYTLPSASQDGYTFNGWVAGNNEPITGSYQVSSDVDFTASYTQNSGGNTGTATLTATNLELGTSYPTSNPVTKTIDGISYNYMDLMTNANKDYIQAKASSGKVENTTAYPGDIISVAITHSGTARATTINGSADGTNWTQVATGSGSITADFSNLGFKYFQITRGANAAYWTKVEITYSNDATPTCAAPTFSPTAGTYTGTQNVSIACTTGGATIYYTLNGTDPTTSSSVYSEALSISETTTVKAMAVKADYNNSAVATATYTIVPPTVATPTFSPAAGTYNEAQNVTIACTTEGATIQYKLTENGEWQDYSSAISVVGTTTIWAKATKTGMDSSEVAEAAYVLTPLAPTFSPVAGSYIGTQTVSIACATEGATLSYKLGDNGTWTNYTEPIEVSQSTTLYAKASKTNWTDSEASAAYNITPINNVSDITEVGTAYAVRGTVVATNSRGFIMGDGTGYVYYYKNAAVTQSVGDKVTITGPTATYGHILQFSNNTTPAAVIATATSSNYNNTPVVTVVDATAIAAYNSDYQLSDYVQYEGTLTKTTGNNPYYNIAVGTATARISYPTTDQATALDALVNKTVRVKGYFAGFSSSYFTTMMESVEEVQSTDPTIEASAGSSLAYNAGSGSIAYEISNYVAGTMTANTTATWISNFVVTPDAQDNSLGEVTFDVDNNTAYENRTATVTLTFTYGRATVTKDVTVTQLSAPYIAVTPNVATIAAAGDLPEFGITYASLPITNENDFAVEFFESNGTTTATRPTWISDYEINAGTTDYVLTVAVEENTDAQRIAYLKVFAYNGNDVVYSDLITITQSAPAQTTIDLRGTTTAISFSPGAFTSSGSGYQSYTGVTYTGSNNMDYSGWTLNNVMHSGTSMQMRASDGSVEMPTIKTDYGFTISVTATTNSVNVSDGTNSGTNSLTVTDTEADITIATGSVYAVISTITITPTPAPTNYDLTVSLNTHINGIYVFDAADENNPLIDDGAAGTTQVFNGTTIHVSPDVENGYLLQSLSVKDANDNDVQTTYVSEGEYYSFIMPASNIIITATAVEAPVITDYQLFSGNLVEGDYIIYYIGYAMKNTVSSNRLQYVEVEPDNNNVISTDDASIVWHIAPSATEGYWTIYSADANAYAASTGSKNQARLLSDGTSDNALWTVTIENNTYDFANKARAAASSDPNNKWLHNNGANGFACYASSTGGALSLYKKVEPTYTLTINGYGDSETTGWNLIASPVDGSIKPATVQNLLGQKISEEGDPDLYNFDLYRFNQTSVNGEWENYHQHNAANEYFMLENGKGYLYARKTNGTLTFYGQPYNGDGVVGLTYDNNAAANMKGWNLVGNPYSTNTTVNKDFYIMNGAGSEIVVAGNNATIAPMQGIFVKATQANQTVTFTPSAKNANANNNASLVMNLIQKRNGIIDRAIVRFNGNTLPKLQLFENSTKLYIPQDDEDFAIVAAETQGTMPVNFRANENGTYTLTVNPENVEMNYLHLIDNMTGADIDLLANPSYTFNATTTDYESRFKLVFASNGASTSLATDESFAFCSNGNWIINNAGNATLQVVDITGRILSSETVNGSVSKTINATPGVYMLRLINGENVKVQKIVVR